ncbi:glutaredoxin-like [Magnolia sinica]|uniref:glutaredoxin-like n=1 Tax=Magnolia sinica TaxID=86752 RepID=UPI00265B6245|nr:glutaredoxin-like [Magnolia sinica]
MGEYSEHYEHCIIYLVPPYILKTNCGYCTRVKKLLSQLGANYRVIELDVKSDGDTVQSTLVEWTGQRTVPNLFINGKHISGCNNVTAKHNDRKLVPLLTEAGAIANTSS